jgi:peroxiredoxin Q/BCP
MTLNIGDKAPNFTAKDQDGNEVILGNYKGKKVVLYFYPKDDTPGCTAQACNLRDNFSELKAKGVVVVGVSTDSGKSHKKFEDKYKLPFTLVSDEDKTIVNEYGLWGEKKFMGKAYMGTARNTFLINEEGVIDHIITKVDTKGHTKQIIDIWGI